jgi:hypothetical protein
MAWLVPGPRPLRVVRCAVDTTMASSVWHLASTHRIIAVCDAAEALPSTRGPSGYESQLAHMAWDPEEVGGCRECSCGKTCQPIPVRKCTTRRATDINSAPTRQNRTNLISAPGSRNRPGRCASLRMNGIGRCTRNIPQCSPPHATHTASVVSSAARRPRNPGRYDEEVETSKRSHRRTKAVSHCLSANR